LLDEAFATATRQNANCSELAKFSEIKNGLEKFKGVWDGVDDLKTEFFEGLISSQIALKDLRVSMRKEKKTHIVCGHFGNRSTPVTALRSRPTAKTICSLSSLSASRRQRTTHQCQASRLGTSGKCRNRQNWQQVALKIQGSISLLSVRLRNDRRCISLVLCLSLVFSCSNPTQYLAI
jgi:hypothetical protein